MSKPKTIFRYSASVSSEPMSRKTPFLLRGNLRESVDILRELGYAAVELQIRDPHTFLDQESWLHHYCSQNDFFVSAVGTGSEFVLNHLSLSDPNPAKRKAAVIRMKEHIDLAASFNTDVILGTMRGNLADGQTEEEYMTALKESVIEVCDKIQVFYIKS